MKKALFCYFGRFGDHTAPIPGHPLYQIFFLNSISKKFGIDKFDIFYYDEYDYDIKDNFVVLSEYRQKLKDALIDKDNLSFDEALNNKYDVVFLKYRFRNYSRLKEGSLDRLKFEKLADVHYNNSWIIDTDAEIKKTDYFPRILSLFLKDFDYPSKHTTKIIPVLHTDIQECIREIEKKEMMMFIGNEYNKSGIHNILELSHKWNLKTFVQGKWKKQAYIDSILDRTDRVYGYRNLENALFTVQASKDIYQTYDFMSPRIFESYLLSTLVFGNYSFFPKFSKYSNDVVLQEKIRFLTEINSKEYFKILKLEIEELYSNLEEVLDPTTM